jgi:hypothetical protein
MAVTKAEFWLVSLFFIIVLSTSLLLWGNGLQAQETVDLDADSDEYLDSFSSFVDNAEFNELTSNKTDLNISQTNPLLTKLGELPLVSDVVGVVNWIIDKTTAVFNMLAFIYNLPSFFANSFGFPADDVKHIINITVYLLTIFIIIIMVRMTK